MENYIILNKRKYKKKALDLINILKLKESFKNKRTVIWENDDIQVSIDRTLIRILIYSTNDIKYYTNLFFQGEYNG